MTAVKGINLVPEDVQARWRLWKRRKILLFVSAVYVAALFFVFVSQRVALSGKKAVISSLEAQKEGLASKGSEYARLSTRMTEIQQAEAELKKKFEVSTILSEKRIAWSVLLKRLSNDIPGNVWLRTFSTSDINDQAGKKIRFVGTAASNRAVSEFVFMLENSGYFEEATLLYTQKKEYGTNSFHDFEVYSTLKKTEEIMYE
ncbi:MAG: PilN domain-containing protein [Deltaproteobacteria bacterium]